MSEFTIPLDRKASTASYAMEPKRLEELLATPTFLERIGKKAAPYLLALGIGGGAAMTAVPTQADITAALVEPGTTITLINPTQKTVTGKVNYVRIDGINNETVTYTIPANGSVNVPNPVTAPINADPAATIVPDVDPSTGAQFSDPQVSVFTCDGGQGYTLPTWTKEQLQNTKPMSGIGVTGLEWLIIASGDQECTVTLEYYGPNREGPFYSTPIHIQPFTTTTAQINHLEGGVSPPNSPFNVLLDSASQSNARVAELRVDDATLDKSVSELMPYTDPGEQYTIDVTQYVMDNGVTSTIVTHPGEQTVKDILKVNDLGVLPHLSFGCEDLPDPAVNSIDEVIHNYLLLSPAEQQQWAGDTTTYQKFTNDSNGDGRVCDPGETDGAFIYLMDILITPNN